MMDFTNFMALPFVTDENFRLLCASLPVLSDFALLNDFEMTRIAC